MRGSGDVRGPAAMRANFIRHILVPDHCVPERFAAVCDWLNRQSCRFVAVDPEHGYQSLCPAYGLALRGFRGFRGFRGLRGFFAIRISLHVPAATGRGICA